MVERRDETSSGAETDRLITIAEAASITSYPESVILDWLRSGLPHCTGATARKRMWTKHVRIRLSALWAWVDSLTVTRVPPPEPEGRSKRARAVPRKPAPRSLSAWREQGGK